MVKIQIMHIESDHIRGWIESGEAIFVAREISFEFGRYLSEQLWMPSGMGIDWGGNQAREINISAATARQKIDWLKSTCLRNEPYLVFWYGPDEPCIACRSDFAIINIDYAFWRAPGKRYLFGSRMGEGGIQPSFFNFAEYDGAEVLRTRC